MKPPRCIRTYELLYWCLCFLPQICVQAAAVVPSHSDAYDSGDQYPRPTTLETDKPTLSTRSPADDDRDLADGDGPDWAKIYDDDLVEDRDWLNDDNLVEDEEPNGHMYEVRNFEYVAEQGAKLRTAEPLAQDVSRRGSEIVDSIQHQYAMFRAPGLIKSITYYGMAMKMLPTFSLSTQDDFPIPCNRIIINNQRPGQSHTVESHRPYSFMVAGRSGILVIHAAFKNLDAAKNVEEKVSEIYWRIWYDEVQLYSESEGTKLHDLKYISLNKVENPETRKFLLDAFYILDTEGWGPRLSDRPVKKLSNGNGLSAGLGFKIHVSDARPVFRQVFHALIASRAGKAVTRMTLEHSNALRGKRVVAISGYMYAPNDPKQPKIVSMAFELGVPQPEWLMEDGGVGSEGKEGKEGEGGDRMDIDG
ncbi:hypothetical protein ABW19_dt0205765 [Dactylella cylindrospora]|nr:hypothetical protein ABW19_dt0205765 [Dactylella cylindrospora]